MYWTKRIRDLREDHDLSKKELANQLGISERTLSRYEAGTSEPTIGVIIQLALMFNISADYICGITEEMNIKDPSVKDDIIDLLDKLNAIAKRL
ncbi:MAG: helix-turn-helix domain-containing protein [Anaeroplasma bactoclasticum]|nr:helix-turn-helix domain-containing protein [Staphylococcus sp.]MCM1350110.1 helix-turn-helix domain-containing protein [Prevotella sp.]MCM1513972.1 helix-turn-helix domain-containing protein [Anaeroplasma bactoclasticum]